jgi:transposase-like protein
MGKGRMRKLQRYSNEFKITAIKLADLPGTRIQDVARILYIHPFMLSRWKKQYREGKITGHDQPIPCYLSEQLPLKVLIDKGKKAAPPPTLLFSGTIFMVVRDSIFSLTMPTLQVRY